MATVPGGLPHGAQKPAKAAVGSPSQYLAGWGVGSMDAAVSVTPRCCDRTWWLPSVPLMVRRTQICILMLLLYENFILVLLVFLYLLFLTGVCLK